MTNQHSILSYLIIISIFFLTSHAWCLGERQDLNVGLHPGVSIYRCEWDEERCVFYVAEMARSHSDLNVEVALGGETVLGRETVRSICNRVAQNGKRALVAINGGFGLLAGRYEGALRSIHIHDGEIVSMPASGKPSKWQNISDDARFGVTRTGDFIADWMGAEVMLKINNGMEIPISGINVKRTKYCPIVLYTPRFGHSTRSRGRGYEVVLEGVELGRPIFPLTAKYHRQFVIQNSARAGNTTIPKNGAVISFQGDVGEEFLSIPHGGEICELSISLEPNQWNDIIEGIGGNVTLIREGQINPMLVAQHQAEKHVPGKRSNNLIISHEPRTALGFNEEKLFLIVVDGRQPRYSTGMSLYELANVMLFLGAQNAINLDGGTSSIFVVDGEIVNQPPNGKERPVLNAVLITTNSRVQVH